MLVHGYSRLIVQLGKPTEVCPTLCHTWEAGPLRGRWCQIEDRENGVYRYTQLEMMYTIPVELCFDAIGLLP